MKTGRVSIIIPVYNSARTINAVLDSVFNQTVPKLILEIIIINDGSKDNSEEIIKDYITKHHSIPIYYYSQDNKGASAARNVGLKVARGEFVALLDSDDIWLPHKIERQLDILDQYPEIVFLGAAYTDKPFYRRGRRIMSLFKAKISDIYWSYFPVTPSVIFRRYAIDKVGYFDEHQRYGEDIQYFQRFCIIYNYYYLPEKLVSIGIDKHFFGGSGLTSNLKGMHEGEKKNLQWLLQNNGITYGGFLFFSLFLELKYWGRIIVRNVNKIVYEFMQ